jgi:4-amino-4-deoxy-L-arabinose transferase-like glycosyltransferase
MLLNDAFLSTTLNGEPRYDKPILIYWFQAISVTLFGQQEWAFRLPSAIFSCLWILVFWDFIRRHFSNSAATFGVVIMTSCLHVSFMGKAATADPLLNMWLAMAGLWTWDYHVKRKQKTLDFVFIVISLGFLTKGPVAVLIPLAVNCLYCLKQRDMSLFWRMTFNPRGLILFLAISAPWYIAVTVDQGQAFIDGFFIKHNIRRFKSPMEGHHGSLLYYLPVALIGLCPFTTLFIRWLKTPKAWFSTPIKTWLSLWVGFVFIFFSCSGTKLPHYVMYGYTPLLILMAISIDPNERPTRWLFLPGMCLSLVLGLLPELVQLALPTVRHEWTQIVMREGLDEFSVSYRWFFYGAIIMHLLAMMRPPKDMLNSMTVMALFSILALNAFAIPTYGQIAQRPIKQAGLFAKEQQLDVVLWGMSQHPSFVLYSEKLAPKRRPKVGEIALTKKMRLEREAQEWEILFEDNGIVLVKILSYK